MLDQLSETTAPINVGFRLLTSEVKDLTEDEVVQFRTYPATSTERELKDGRITHLDQKVEMGLAVTFHWVTAAVKELKDQVRRLNGQHSSIMLQKRMAAGKFPKGLKVFREHYEVDDGNGLALLFRQFDDRASSRQPIDVSGVYQGLHPQLAVVNRKIGKLAIDGYTWYQRNVEKVPTPIGDDSYSAFNDSGLFPYILWLNDLFAVKSKEMQFPAIVAAIVGTYMRSEAAARTFWQEVVTLADGDDDPTPQNTLSNWLLTIKADKIDRPDPAHLYQGCIYAWNAYRDGRSIAAINDNIKKNLLTIHD